jgi:hypothetical protein
MTELEAHAMRCLRGEASDHDHPRPSMAELRAANALDLKRYRWLRSQMHAEGWADCYVCPSHGDWGAAHSIRTGAALDAAVDEAMRGA